MIIPSIDLSGGQTVQWIGGRDHALDAGDPRPIAERFGLVSEIAVVDLDAALGRGSNAALIQGLLPIASCRVGGGIRDVETAIRWLDAGASKVVLGTAAVPEVLKCLPAARVIAALDAYEGEVVVEGWRKPTGRGIVERMQELEGLVGGFLVTFVEQEGRMQGTRLDQVEALVQAAGKARLTIAGGVTTCQEIATLDAQGADAQIGMALYTGRLELGDAIAAVLRSDRPDGLWSTIIVDEHGCALGLAYSSRESLAEAVRTRCGVYQSRSRGLWVKGKTSGALQELLRIDVDCDRDVLRFTVRQKGAGFCHNDTWTCFGPSGGIPALSRRLSERVADAPEGSYTRRLLTDPTLLSAKLAEEASELAQARSREEVVGEASDVLYFTLVALARAGASLSEVEAELDRRALKVTRRPGEAKPRAKEGE